MALLGVTERAIRGWLRLRGVRARSVVTTVGRVHVFDARGRGSLPTIVLQHGIGAGNAVQFAHLVLLLRRHARRVVALDLPGHGLSEPARPAMTPETVFAGFADALDQVLDEPAVLVGNSLGGAMVLQYALARPERARGLLLASPAGAAVDDAGLGEFLARFEMADDAATLEFLRRLYHRVPFFARLFAGDIRASFRSEHLRGLLAAVRPHHSFTPEVLAAVRAPTLVVWGRSDRVMMPGMLEFFRTHLACRVEEPEGVGHCPHLDRPFWTLRRVVDFARELA